MFERSAILGLCTVAIWSLCQGDCLYAGDPITDGLLASLASQGQVAPHTNAYHLTLTWDSVSNADAYAVIVRSNGIETQRVWTLGTEVTVSNLSRLDACQFTAIATNSAGISAESAPAVIHWMTVIESDSSTGPWTLLATNSFVPTAPQHFVALSNYNALALAKPD